MSGLLEIDGLEAGYGPVRALHGISLWVQQGEVAAMLGPNGAGKTTTRRAVSGMVRTRGSIRFDGTSLAGRSTESIARIGIAHVPEGRGNFPTLSVADNLRLGAIIRRDQAAVGRDLERCYQALARLVREQATTLLVVEQKANLVLEFADRAYVLEAGRIVLSGTAAQIRADEGMRRSYLGY